MTFLLAIGAPPVLAGGGGENMLLLVNPTDEPSLRIANAYVKARSIPVSNIIYITAWAGHPIIISESTFTSVYTATLPGTIAARGLTNQIDYIGTIGQPHSVHGYNPSYMVGFNNCLNQLTQIANGGSTRNVKGCNSPLFQGVLPAGNLTTWSYVRGSNPAVYHSQLLNGEQWYMSGAIGYSDVRGLNPSVAVESLQRTAKADGTNPQGAIYFEDSGDGTRVGPRSMFWPAIQKYLTSVGVPWVQEYSITPKNRANVRGAMVGSANPTVATQIVNGSAYLPGSYADDLTSFAGSYGVGSSQTVVSNFLLGGAGATAGTVDEPTNGQSRFTWASVYAFSEDGSTLGEAFYKSLQQPDLIFLQGDILSQAYADVPIVTFTAGPDESGTVSGAITVSGSAQLNNPRLATGIAKLNLFVDGVQQSGSITGNAGSFNLDTTSLTDGIHEIRIVAYNNSQAASQGRAIRNIVVNNQNQSVAITGPGSYLAAWNQTLSIPVLASQGSGAAFGGIQLQVIGRVVGSISSSSGSISLDVTKLAYGQNTITPVAVLASGTQMVQGPPITVTRQMQQFSGTNPTPLDKRNPGADFSFFGNVAGGSSTLDNINWNANPSMTLHSVTTGIAPDSTYSPSTRNMPTAFYTNGYYAYGLAIQIKCKFTVAAPGEYFFTPSFASYTSAGIYVDGTLLAKQDQWNSSTSSFGSSKPPENIYLLPGEHSLVIKLAESRSGRSAYETTFALVMRGPDGNTIGASGPFFYTVK